MDGDVLLYIEVLEYGACASCRVLLNSLKAATADTADTASVRLLPPYLQSAIY